MEPMTMAALSLAEPLYNIGTGIVQGIRANSLEKELGNRPTRLTPSEMQKALKRAESLATQRELPSMGIQRDRLRGSTASGANAIAQSASGGEALGALANMYTGEQRSIADLAIAGEQNWLNNQDRLTNMQNAVAQEQNKNWEWNTAQPYLNQLDAISKLRSGAIQNVGSGLGAGAQNMMYMNYLDPNFTQGVGNQVKGWFGGGGNNQGANVGSYTLPNGYNAYSTNDLLNSIG